VRVIGLSMDDIVPAKTNKVRLLCNAKNIAEMTCFLNSRLPQVVWRIKHLAAFVLF
jgi:hypothetical protein